MSSSALALLHENMCFLCDQTRMLTGITTAYGTPDAHESAIYGHAQEVTLSDGRFLPCIRPLRDDTLFDLASLTKLFTAVLTMILVEQKRLDLDQPIGRLDSRFAQIAHIPVREILTFRVSLQTPGRLDDPDCSREEALARLFAVRAVPTPAVRVYSDINAMVIKYVVEAASGCSFAQALSDRILTPLGMRDTFCHVPPAHRDRCMCYDYEHRIVQDRYILRTDTPCGTPHDPKALRLSLSGDDLCGHAGLFSSRTDMVRFAQALLDHALIGPDSLRAIGTDYTGRPNADGTYRQSLGCLCFTRHPVQQLSEVPAWMSENSIGLSGFTGNHLSLDPSKKRFVLFLGNRCHHRVSHITLSDEAMSALPLDAIGAGLVPWPDGRAVPSSARYVRQKDARLHTPIQMRMRELGWL